MYTCALFYPSYNTRTLALIHKEDSGARPFVIKKKKERDELEFHIQVSPPRSLIVSHKNSRPRSLVIKSEKRDYAAHLVEVRMLSRTESSSDTRSRWCVPGVMLRGPCSTSDAMHFMSPVCSEEGAVSEWDAFANCFLGAFCGDGAFGSRLPSAKPSQ